MRRIERWASRTGQCPRCGGVSLSHYSLEDATICDACGHEETGMDRMNFVGGPWPEYAAHPGMSQPAHSDMMNRRART